jgi:serralysin
VAEESLHACIDRVIPKELEGAMRVAHAKEHGLRGRPPFELALSQQKMWKAGRKLRVCFLDGDPKVHQKVALHAKQWMDYANIIFDFVDGKDGEIRISFQQPGYWSAVGTDALVEEYFAKGEPTMNFHGISTTTPEEKYSHVVLHEFGHALGCIHEHQNPAAGIRWNREAIYRDLGGPPNNWNRQTVDHNMFETYSTTATQFTEFDPLSIMLYAFPSGWTSNGMTFPENRVLSDTDKRFIASRYPK